MRIPKVYLETSVFNFIFADDAPDRRRDAVKLFAEIQEGKYVPFTSQYVERELFECSEPKRGKMLDLFDQYDIRVLPISEEAELLADIYIEEGMVSPRYRFDAIHIAMASIHDVDFIVSYNFKHIVKRKTVMIAESINLREGYRRVGIFSPTEVIDNVG